MSKICLGWARDYLKVGQVMELLRQRGVRLIAINDNVDSANGDNDFTPFLNIMYEFYARDTSRKIRSVFKAKGMSGKHLTGHVAYGYLWDEWDEKREYLGHTVNFKTRKHFKDKKSHYVPEDEWTIFENTHTPIIGQKTFDNVQRIRGNVKRYPDGWGEAAPLTGLMYCADCGGKMYVHRTYNGKRTPQYTCAQYSKVPVGTLCPTQHRISEKVVLDPIIGILLFFLLQLTYCNLLRCRICVIGRLSRKNILVMLNLCIHVSG